MALSSEQGFPFWLAWGTFRQGWVLAEQGQERKELRRCARVWPPAGPRGQS